MGLISHAIEMPNALVDVVLLVGMDDNTALIPLEKVHTCDKFPTGIREIFLSFQGGL